MSPTGEIKLIPKVKRLAKDKRKMSSCVDMSPFYEDDNYISV